MTSYEEKQRNIITHLFCMIVWSAMYDQKKITQTNSIKKDIKDE